MILIIIDRNTKVTSLLDQVLSVESSEFRARR